MAPRKKEQAPQEVQQAFAELGNVLNDGVSADWTAVDHFPLGALVESLGPLDAGVMIRSSERGDARSIGVFVGGASQWTTCRNQTELLAMLEAIHAHLEGLIGRRRSPEPVVAPKRPAKRS